MTAPPIYVVVRRDRDVGDNLVAWTFDEATAEAKRLNAGEWGPHVVDEVPSL